MDEIEDFSEKLAETDISDPQMQIPPELPVLPLRDIVIYPFMIVPLFVSRDRSIKAVDEALSQNRMILLVSQKDVDKEEPAQEDLYKVGTVAVIMRMLKLPDGRIRILIQGLSRAQVESVDAERRLCQAQLTPIPEPTSAPEFFGSRSPCPKCSRLDGTSRESWAKTFRLKFWRSSQISTTPDVWLIFPRRISN